MLGPMLPLALATSLAVLVAGGGALPPPTPLAVVRVPDEPGAIVLPDSQPTVQAVAADLDGDGAPELVRLMGGRSGPLYVEAYRETGGSWAPAASRITAVPGAAGLGEAAYARRPARLLLRQVSGRDRVTLVVQPSFSEPEAERECCLLIHDLVLDGEALRIEQVADPSDVADAVHAIDLDGDGTDELLASYFLAPLNDASSLTEARVFRWADDHFAPPTATRLPVGSGSTPIILGDSDGVPGDEAAFISSSALDALFRISLGPDDTLITEDSGLIVDDALAVPLSRTQRGVAVLTPRYGLGVLSWPRGKPPSVPIASQPIERARLVGVVDIGASPRLLVHRTAPDELHIRSLPDLASTLPRGPIAPSQAAAMLANGPLASLRRPAARRRAARRVLGDRRRPPRPGAGPRRPHRGHRRTGGGLADRPRRSRPRLAGDSARHDRCATTRPGGWAPRPARHPARLCRVDRPAHRGDDTGGKRWRL